MDDKKYAAILCAGDDSTDESMFEITAPNFISIKVGRQPSRAKYRLSDPAEFRKFLREALLDEAETRS